MALLENPTTLAHWQQKANKLPVTTQAFINGKFADAISGKVFEKITPATCKPIAHIAACSQPKVSLAAAVWSRDLNKALTIARRLEAGMAWVNPDDITMPFGGYKQSGLSRDK